MWGRTFQKRIIGVAVNTSNGVERKNKDSKYLHLNKFKDKLL